MFSNATVCITRGGITYDEDTGYRVKQDDCESVLYEARCVFSQKNARKVTARDGIREFTKPLHTLLIHDNSDIKVQTGDTATVTVGEVTTVFSVTSSVYTAGVMGGHWEIDIEKVELPTE